MSEPTSTNHLAHETSPYLLQHAHNPVDWYPWGEDALQRAREEDKPIFLSIGYSACHWCHVMEHESFSDPDTAAVMNRLFVSIKVDREERPDLDSLYMDAVQALTGHGGWPLSVFLTPDGRPFYGGTYFPPQPAHGLPAFRQLLEAVAQAYRDRRASIADTASRITAALQSSVTRPPSGDLDPRLLEQAERSLLQQLDPQHGGFGGAPKFPQAPALEFLLQRHVVNHAGEVPALSLTLEQMARGGIYDQLGGGFHRYSTDARWLVPHFEKMLYDNAQLARLYLHAWQVTGDGFFRAIAEETLDYVAREMTDPEGGFYSAQDADSEGEEGRYFVWTPAEIEAVLGDETEGFMAAHGVTEAGNFEGRNILQYVGGQIERPRWAPARLRLLEARRRRVHPARDDKVLTSWNGLMLAAFAEAARVLDRSDYRQIAERNAGFLLREMTTPEGRLLHTWRAGQAKGNGFLEDYSHLIAGLLELYQTSFDRRWYQAAAELGEVMVAHFAAPDGGFFDTSDDHEALIARPRSPQDGALPSGGAMAAGALLRLAGLGEEGEYADLARRAIASAGPHMARGPLGFGKWLQALGYLLAPAREIAIVGEPGEADTEALLRVVRQGYRPHQVVALGAPQEETEVIPLLRGRGRVEGRATAYVCQGFTCGRPVTDPAALAALLA